MTNEVMRMVVIGGLGFLLGARVQFSIDQNDEQILSSFARLLVLCVTLFAIVGFVARGWW